MSNIYRALCAELVEQLQRAINDYGFCLEASNALMHRARAAVMPEPVAPTDEELEAAARAAEIQYMKEHGGLSASTLDGIHAQLQAQRLAGLRAVAARPTIQPVPVGSKAFHWRNLGDGKPVQVQQCLMCGIAPANVDDCGRFGDPACPYFGVGKSKYERGYAQEHLARLMRDAIGTETNHNVYTVAAGKILDRPEFAHVARWSTPANTINQEGQE